MLNIYSLKRMKKVFNIHCFLTNSLLVGISRNGTGNLDQYGAINNSVEFPAHLTALMLACHEENYEMTSYLLKMGQRLEMPDIDTGTTGKTQENNCEFVTHITIYKTTRYLKTLFQLCSLFVSIPTSYNPYLYNLIF